jgi:hypothetical protein
MAYARTRRRPTPPTRTLRVPDSALRESVESPETFFAD